MGFGVDLRPTDAGLETLIRSRIFDVVMDWVCSAILSMFGSLRCCRPCQTAPTTW